MGFLPVLNVCPVKRSMRGIELIKEMPQTEGSLWLEGNNGFEACATQGLRQMMGTSTSDASDVEQRSLLAPH